MAKGQVWDSHGTVMGQSWDRYGTGKGRDGTGSSTISQPKLGQIVHVGGVLELSGPANFKSVPGFEN